MTKVLLAIVAGLGMAHIGAFVLRSMITLEHPLIQVYVYFHMGVEANLPTYISALFLLLAGLLLLLVGVDAKRCGEDGAWHWIGLACGILFLSIDEASRFHETLIRKMIVSQIGQGVDEDTSEKTIDQELSEIPN